MARITPPTGPRLDAFGQVLQFQAAHGLVSRDGLTPRGQCVFREGESWLLVRQVA
jgi:hypothetical protein